MEKHLLRVLFQDDHFVAINKPSGLLMHPTPIDRHEKITAQKQLESQLNRNVYIIHRLDKPTSGICLFALSSEAANKTAAFFEQKEIQKTYLAIVRGYSKKQDTIDTALSEVADKVVNKRKKADGRRKPAVTKYRRLAKVELPVHISRHPNSRYSLLEVHPQTGRMHQIRRHLKHTRYPIIGDTKYGDHKHNRYFREKLNCQRMLLAATELSFSHPFTGENLKITAPIDDGFRDIIELFNWADSLPDEWLN